VGYTGERDQEQEHCSLRGRHKNYHRQVHISQDSPEASRPFHTQKMLSRTLALSLGLLEFNNVVSPGPFPLPRDGFVPRRQQFNFQKSRSTALLSKGTYFVGPGLLSSGYSRASSYLWSPSPPEAGPSRTRSPHNSRGAPSTRPDEDRKPFGLRRWSTGVKTSNLPRKGAFAASHAGQGGRTSPGLKIWGGGGLHINEKRFRGGLVCKAHRWSYHPTLGSRVRREGSRRSTLTFGDTTPYLLSADVTV